MKSDETKRLVAKSENATVEFKSARGGVVFLPTAIVLSAKAATKAVSSRKRRVEMTYNIPSGDFESSKGDLLAVTTTAKPQRATAPFENFTKNSSGLWETQGT